MTDRNGTTVSWLASNYPKSIVKDGSSSSVFEYTPDRRRWRHEYKSGGTTYSHVYLGNLLEKVSSGGVTEWKHYLQANGKAFALYIRSSSGATTSRYLFNDHLGSGDLLTDTAGAVVLRESFDAYGKRRGSAWSGEPSAGELATMNATTRRGFTMHEHLDSTGLIHMNGRVYDPLVARFLSADPLIDGATNPHGWNRFGYAKNRPLTFTDPHGFCSGCHGGGGIGGSTSSSGGGFFGWVRGLFGGSGGSGGSGGGGASFADLSPVRVTIPRLNDDLTAMQEVKVFGDPTPPSPELRVDSLGPFDEPSGGPMPRNLGSGGQLEDEPQGKDPPCSAFSSGVLELTGGQSNQSPVDDVVDNFMTTQETSIGDVIADPPGVMDISLSAIPEEAVSAYYGGRLVGVWGGVTPFNALRVAFQSRGAPVRIPGLIGFRTPLQLATTAGVTWATNALLIGGVYNAGVLAGSVIRTGANRAAAAACSP